MEPQTMPMIFPGMDPYLEDPHLWPGIHNRLIVYLADHLQPKLRPRYIATLEERVFLEGPQRSVVPDVLLKRRQPAEPKGGIAVAGGAAPIRVRVPALEIHETYVAIVDRSSGQQVVTVIEVISPSNKHAGPGRDSYVAKQREILCSQTHLVEIDLLRTGRHVQAVPEWIAQEQGDYETLTCVNRAGGLREDYDLYLQRLRERLPIIGVPLADDDPDVLLDLPAVLAQTYEAGLYREFLRYDAPCVPPLSQDDQAWADQLIREAAQAET